MKNYEIQPKGNAKLQISAWRCEELQTWPDYNPRSESARFANFPDWIESGKQVYYSFWDNMVQIRKKVIKTFWAILKTKFFLMSKDFCVKVFLNIIKINSIGLTLKNIVSTLKTFLKKQFILPIPLQLFSRSDEYKRAQTHGKVFWIYFLQLDKSF